MKDATVALDRCKALEAELKDLCDKHAEEARDHQAEEERMMAREDAVKGHDTELARSAEAQATERGRLDKLE